MSELHIEGYICNDHNGIIALSDNKNLNSYDTHSIVNSIESLAYECGMVGESKKGLGSTRAIIDDCSLRIYFTDEECSLEEAMINLDCLLYGGDIVTKVSKVGYSEYTITGLNLDELSIGGHDIESELRSHYGEYCHIIIEG